MDTRLMVLLVIAFVAIILIVTLLVLRKRRSDRLKQHFGPEYDRTVKEQGALRAETVLAEREQRVKKFAIHSLTRDDRERYLQEWTQVQKQFVDDPALAVSDADKLVTEVMASRGYPMGDFEQRAADVSVNYPGVVQNYRSARASWYAAVADKPAPKTYGRPWFTSGRCLTSCSTYPKPKR